MSAFKVSASVHSRSTDVCRLDLDAATSTVGSVDSVSMVWRVSEWLHGLGMSTVSLFVFSCRFVTHMLDLHLYRSDLYSSVSMPGSNDPTGRFRGVSAWLHGPGTSALSRFTFLSLADFYSFEFEPSVSTSTSRESVRTICTIGGWPGRHR